MQKMWFMIMLVALLLGQVPLAGSVVICTTEDGQAHLETLDHHDHGLMADQAQACDHGLHVVHSDVCIERLSQGACCRDIAVDCVSPSLVEAKRVGQDTHSSVCSLIKAYCSLGHPTRMTSLFLHSVHAGPDILRSVILLI